MKNEDGGYFGLKGYSFQYIVSMMKILNTEDENEFIELEQVEDISTEKEIIQVKYKENSNFYPSGIRKPVIKLIEEMKSDDKKLILYCYFKNIENLKKIDGRKVCLDKEISIGASYLKRILGDKQDEFPDSKKQVFISKFSIVFTKKYNEQFLRLIKKIREVYSCDEDEALIHYSCFMNYLITKVVKNKTSEYENRKCSRKEFDILVENSKTIIINSHLEYVLGKKGYYSLVKKKLGFCRKPDNTEKIFVIDVDKVDDIQDLIITSKELSKKFFIIKNSRGRKCVDSPAPYIYFRGATTSQLTSLKKYLVSNDCMLLDGYPFLGSDFLVDYIIQKTGTHTDFRLKIINDDKCMEQIMEKFETNKILVELYEFYRLETMKKAIGESVYQKIIKISDLKDINDYLLT